MSVFNTMNVSATGMTAQRLRMDTISQNIANINTTRGDNGSGPYRRKIAVFEEISTQKNFSNMLNQYLGEYSKVGGVKVKKIAEDKSPFISLYDPTHPDANKEGYVLMPNVNSLEEMTNLISANRSYEANVTAFNSNKSMLSKALEIGR
ncbi:MAG: flagellar basal body rod protein FlgC [Firmicutes bacterium HGW-Firmicutes-1]|jgi:flagellar basal-body rod protein FlgC|nr:MAG: flagellar basal body rod protein FlgC [Firmicutes bacterium HGW-Firmicutes-1]